MKSAASALTFALVSATVAVVACTPLEKGFTECNGSICQPGQYCDAARFCVNGCTSDANCQEGDACEDIDDFSGVGICSNPSSGEGEGEGEGEGDPLANCRAACDAFQGCGLSAAETADCRSDCATLNTEQQTAIGNCRDEGCGSIRQCAGVECFNDGQCGGDAVCLDYSCL
jgi:hypothetical protein